MSNVSDFMHKGKILMLALDHRGSFKKLINPEHSESVTAEQVVSIKQQIIEAVYSQFSGVLIDSESGLPAYQKVLASKAEVKPYMLCIEKTGYEDEAGARKTTLEFSVSELHRLGAKGVKLLLYYHPNAPTREHQLHVGKEVLDACRKADLPLFLEIVTYTLPGFNTHRPELILDSVNQFLEAGIMADVFKLEYPGDPAACFAVTQILGKTPWILLTKGNDFNKFKADLNVAVQNGAVGFLAGRSVWQEFAQYPVEKQADYFNTVVVQRFAEICKIVSGS